MAGRGVNARGHRHYVAGTAARIIRALKERGQMHKRMLCTALNCDYRDLDATMAEMRRRGDVIVLGTAAQAGYRDINSHAPVYGLPGMELVIQRRADDKRSSGKSGVIAGPILIGRGYKWGAGLA